MEPAEQLSLFDAAAAARLLTIPDAARLLSVGRSTFYELIADGRIEVVHIGRSARVSVGALVAFVRSLSTTVSASPYALNRSLAAPVASGQPDRPVGSPGPTHARGAT
jgi:excisionase family DNA binding protein